MSRTSLGCKCSIIMALWLIIPENAFAQPMRQLPGVRPFLAGQLPQQRQPNSRVRPAASQVGLESTDFYIKNGYPKQLGDFVESGAALAGGAGGVAGAGGNNGVQAAGSMGFQGNTGNQIGQNAGGTILGGLFGGGGAGGGFAGATGFRAGNQMGSSASGLSFTGGGFSGAVPKGFGFGGSSSTADWNAPLHGVAR